MNDTLTDNLNRLQTWDKKKRRQLEYLYHLAANHPTPHGRKRAAIMHAGLVAYMLDVHDAFKAVKTALWPEEGGDNVAK
jgi:hypothetical protein